MQTGSTSMIMAWASGVQQLTMRRGLIVCIPPDRDNRDGSPVLIVPQSWVCRCTMVNIDYGRFGKSVGAADRQSLLVSPGLRMRKAGQGGRLPVHSSHRNFGGAHGQSLFPPVSIRAMTSSVRMWGWWATWAACQRNILECYRALDILTGEDCRILPLHRHTDVWHGTDPGQASLHIVELMGPANIDNCGSNVGRTRWQLRRRSVALTVYCDILFIAALRKVIVLYVPQMSPSSRVEIILTAQKWLNY